MFGVHLIMRHPHRYQSTTSEYDMRGIFGVPHITEAVVAQVIQSQRLFPALILAGVLRKE